MMIWQEECQAKGQIKIYYPLKVQLIMVFWHEKQISLSTRMRTSGYLKYEF
jgi:hypothetical protein